MPTYRDPDRRDRLAAAAAELIRSRGYHAVGINDIGAAAGISGPAVYRHFPDKQAILAHVLLRSVEDTRAAVDSALATLDGSAADRVAAMLVAVADATLDQRDAGMLWRWEGRHLSREQQREIGRRSSALISAWSGALRQVRPQLPEADAELLCWAAVSVFGSAAVHHTTVARPRFAQLLASIAGRVLHAQVAVAPVEKLPALDPGSRREQLLAAAADLFHRHGFHAVTMQDIGAAVGIAGPSVYRHFPGKQAILCAIARRAADRLAVDAERALRTCPTESAALHQLVASYLRVLTASPDLTVALSIDVANLDERDRADLRLVQRDYVARWAGLLQAVHPELNPREAKITVHAALTIANDLTRTRRFAARPDLPGSLACLMVAALDC